MNVIITTAIDGLTSEQRAAFVDATRAWLGNLESERTRKTYAYALKQFGTITGKTYDATQADVIAFKNTLAAGGLSQASVNVKLSALSSLFAYLLDNGLVNANPTDGVKRRAVNPYGKATMLQTGDDVKLLASIDRATLDGKRDYAMILMFLTTALRLGELAQIRLDSIQRRGSKAVAHFTGKGGAAESVPLYGNLLAAIQDYLSERGELTTDGPLFASHSNRSNGKPLTERGIQSIIRRRCDDAFGLGHGITPHSLRHTAAVKASKDAPIGAVSKLLRHKNTRITNIYLDHVDTEAVDGAFAELDAAFGGNQP